MFSAGGSVLTSLAHAAEARRNMEQARRLLESGQTPSQIQHANFERALARPSRPMIVQPSNTKSGFGWGTIILAFIAGGLLS